jgi:mannosyl-oligosaccharide alpha-1,2-mannosidase
MLRFRRYRVFLFFAAVAVFAFYRFGSPSYWENPAHSVNVLKEHLNYNGKSTQAKQQQEVFNSKGQDAIGRPREADEVEKPKVVPVQDAIDKPKKVDQVKQNPLQELAKPKVLPSKESPPPVASITKPVQHAPAPVKAKETSTSTQRIRVMPHPIPPGAPIIEQGSGRWEADQLPLDASPIEWVAQTEHFPVPSGSTIALPTGSPKPIPKLQAKFEKESDAVRADRIKKRDAVKEAFLHAWTGYKEKAWGKDELMPMSGGFKNPFNGWGATLIDSLDTMWIMGLKDEFEEALTMVAKVNFKTSSRADIPIFETTIRYLGGLLGAYDVSDGKYRVLLDKAVELGDIMMGSFDTPNRMPDTFYQWKPAFASQPHRASTRVVLAELGSLALEFTRLAQLTKEPRYYDAIARITDALEEWQNHTRLPGMWPTFVDASGCEKIVYKSPNTQIIGATTVQKLDWKGNPIEDTPTLEEVSAQRVAHSNANGPAPPFEKPMGNHGRIEGWDANHPEAGEKSTNPRTKMEPVKLPDPLVFEAKDPAHSKTNIKRQLGNIPQDDEEVKYPDDRDNDPTATEVQDIPATIPDANIPPAHAVAEALPTKESLPECVAHGLNSQSSWGTDEYTLGSMSDSTYEYFPKVSALVR